MLAEGYRFDGAALTGGHRKVELDLFLLPDPATLAIYPSVRRWPTAGQTVLLGRAQGWPAICRRPSLHSRSKPRPGPRPGFDYRVAVEMEYYLCPKTAPCQISEHGAGYFGVAGTNAGTRDDVSTRLQGMGITVGGSHHETGPGQEEIDLPDVGALRMADN